MDNIQNRIIPKTDKAWVWFAALYYAASKTVEYLSKPEAMRREQDSFDYYFNYYLLTGNTADPEPPGWLIYCYKILSEIYDGDRTSNLLLKYLDNLIIFSDILERHLNEYMKILILLKDNTRQDYMIPR